MLLEVIWGQIVRFLLLGVNKLSVINQYKILALNEQAAVCTLDSAQHFNMFQLLL